MKPLFLITLFATVSTINVFTQTPSPASPPVATVGNVCRVIHFGTKPGKNAEFTRFRREHTKPILEEQRRQGLIESFAFYTKPVSNGPDDWDIAQVICFKNYAEAIDFDAERTANLTAIAIKHYGSNDAMIKANDGQTDLRVVFSSFLMREQF